MTLTAGSSVGPYQASGRWVLVGAVGAKPNEIAALPTGVGEPRVLPTDGLEVSTAAWLPDEKGIVIEGLQPGQEPRLYLLPLGENLAAAGKPQPISPPARFRGSAVVTPDGRWAAAVLEATLHLFPIGGGEPRRYEGLVKGDVPVRWTPDGAALWVSRREAPDRVTVFRFEPATGQRKLWKEISGPEMEIERWPAITPDGLSYAYTYSRSSSSLHLAEGLSSPD